MDLIKGALSKLAGMADQNMNGADFKLRDPSKYEFDDGTVSGELSKAEMVVIDGKSGSETGRFKFQFNPQSVTIKKTAKYTKNNTGGYDVPNMQFVGGERSISFPELVFDTAESGKNVWSKHIQPLEKMLHLDEHEHRPPIVMLVWGNFLRQAGGGGNAQTIEAIKCVVTEMSVDYTMFKEDGTPIRAKMTLTLDEIGNKAKKKSPDFAKVYVVRRGDTLQQIAYREYNSAGEWRRIAESNGIDDPLRMRPGTRLLIPPILD